MHFYSAMKVSELWYLVLSWGETQDPQLNEETIGKVTCCGVLNYVTFWKCLNYGDKK